MTNRDRDLAVAILAAGQGKRMGTPGQAKVLALLEDRPLLGYVLEQASAVEPVAIAVIVGHQRDAVAAYVTDVAPGATCVIQEEQRGTGHAVQQTRSLFHGRPLDILILSGDVPLLTAGTLRTLFANHRDSGASLTVLSTIVDDPTGYGRVVRDADGTVAAIVEHKDASDPQRAIREINAGIYCVKAEHLYAALDHVNADNVQQEYYLTDIVAILLSDGHPVTAVVAPDWHEVHGINTVADLERASVLLAERRSVV